MNGDRVRLAVYGFGRVEAMGRSPERIEIATKPVLADRRYQLAATSCT